MTDYDYTLNPYSGCSFGCTYCYAAFFTRNRALQDSWGYWVQVKENAVDRLRRARTPLAGKSIYLSSVTDPYQPVERRLGLVRELLEILADRGAHVVVQTRSPWVTRDIDVFRQLERVRVNMTVTTDSEAVRRVFEPHCPTTEKRLDAISEVAAAGVPTCITATPLLPLDDVERFADRLVATRVPRFVVQPFHSAKGRFVAGTRQAAMDLVARYRWDDEAYARAVKHLRVRLPHLDEGRAGFAPH
ncbi:MAG: radical SAM protein [Actinomycetota bacterium]